MEYVQTVYVLCVVFSIGLVLVDLIKNCFRKVKTYSVFELYTLWIAELFIAGFAYAGVRNGLGFIFFLIIVLALWGSWGYFKSWCAYLNTKDQLQTDAD